MATNEQMAVIQEANDPGALESVNIDIAQNGFTVACSHRPKEKKAKGGGCESVPWQPPKRSVFESRDSLFAYLKTVIPEKIGESYKEEAEED